MSAVPKLCENPCETCAKEGLPLLLARYALVPSDAKAPALSGLLDAPDLKKVPLGASARYALRLLRSGYVYVFDEKRSRWDEYFVTIDGYLSKLPPRIRALRVQAKPETEFRCARNGAAPLAGVITIRNAKHAGKVWIAFSDVEWTDAVFTAHGDAAHRQRHMKCLNVADGKVTPQSDTAPLEQVERTVGEFNLPAAATRDAFSIWCPFPYNAREGAAPALLAAADKVRPGGGAAIVALHDPVGLAQEIAALMEVRKLGFMNEEGVAKPRFAASTIASLEVSIKEQAKLAEIAAGEALAQRAEAGPGAYNPNPALWGVPGDMDEAARWRSHTPQSLQRAADSRWRTYTRDRTGKPRFDQAASRAWLEAYNARFRAFDAEQIAPLANAHVAWLQHPCMVSQLSCNHDSRDSDSGVAYTATIVNLLAHTLDKQPCYDLYLRWLREGTATEQNLVMRALGFNQQALIDKVTAADAAPVDFRAIPSDGVAAAVAAFMEKMPSTANAQLAALLTGLSGPALKYWDEFNAGKVGSKAAAALAAASGRQYVRLPVVGNRGDFVQAYVRQLYLLDPTLKANANQMSKAMAARLRLLEIEGVKMQGSRKLGWYVMLDKEAVSGAASRNLSGQALADELAQAIRTPQDLKKLDMARAMDIRSKAFLGGTALTGVLMLVNFGKLLDDVNKGMSHELAEASAKLMAGKLAIAGFVSEQLGNGLEKLAEQRLRNMMGRAGAMLPRALQVVGRLGGFGVGVFLGLWDISKGVDARRVGDVGLSNAYLASGVAGTLVATAMFGVAMGWVALSPIGWIFMAIGIAIWIGATFIAEAVKDNKLQEWLTRCQFGKNEYADFATHVREYQLALAE